MLERQLEIDCSVVFARSCPQTVLWIIDLISCTSENSHNPEQLNHFQFEKLTKCLQGFTQMNERTLQMDGRAIKSFNGLVLRPSFLVCQSCGTFVFLELELMCV